MSSARKHVSFRNPNPIKVKVPPLPDDAHSSSAPTSVQSRSPYGPSASTAAAAEYEYDNNARVTSRHGRTNRSSKPRDSTIRHQRTQLADVTPRPIKHIPSQETIRRRPRSGSDSSHSSLCTDIVQSTPEEFESIFPSPRTLTIAHDHSYSTGNGPADICITTPYRHEHGGSVILTLFYLVIKDRDDRRMTLRRYGRDSRQEICRSSLRRQGRHSDRRSRRDSGVSSAQRTLPAFDDLTLYEDDDDNSDDGQTYATRTDDTHSQTTSAASSTTATSASTSAATILRLDFRTGDKIELTPRLDKERYDFSWEGTMYRWTRAESPTETTWKLLEKRGSEWRRRPIAQIIAEVLSPRAVRGSRTPLNGDLVPRSDFWIEDRFAYGMEGEFAEVVVATALLALVDDSLRRANERLSLPRQPRRPSTDKFQYYWTGAMM